jgi:hypothetical protein
VAVLVSVALAIREVVVLLAMVEVAEAELVERAVFIRLDPNTEQVGLKQILLRLAQAAVAAAGQSCLTRAGPLVVVAQVEEAGVGLVILETPEIRERQLIQRHIIPFRCHREQVTQFR